MKSSKRSVHFAPANSCTEPDASRSSAKEIFPCGRESMTRPATPTVTPDSSPGTSDDQASTTAAAPWVRSKRYGTALGPVMTPDHS